VPPVKTNSEDKVTKKSLIEIGFAIGSAFWSASLKGQKYNERYLIINKLISFIQIYGERTILPERLSMELSFNDLISIVYM